MREMEARSEGGDIRSRMDGILAVSPNTKVVMLSGSISSSLMADAIAKGAPLEMAHQGHLAEALLQQERRSDTGRGRLTRAPARQTEANLCRGGLLAGEPPT